MSTDDYMRRTDYFKQAGFSSITFIFTYKDAAIIQVEVQVTDRFRQLVNASHLF